MSDAVKEMGKDWVVMRGAAGHKEAAIGGQCAWKRVVLNLQEALRSQAIYRLCQNRTRCMLVEERQMVSSRDSPLYFVVSSLLEYFLINSQ